MSYWQFTLEKDSDVTIVLNGPTNKNLAAVVYNEYIEAENGTQYNEFYKKIGEDNYYVNSYNNRLIYDITIGLFQNIWSNDIKSYLGMDS